MYLEEGASAFFVKAVLSSAIVVAYYYFLQRCFNLIKSTIISFHTKRKSKKITKWNSKQYFESTLARYSDCCSYYCILRAFEDYLRTAIDRTSFGDLAFECDKQETLQKKNFFLGLNWMNFESNQIKQNIDCKRTLMMIAYFFPIIPNLIFFLFSAFFLGGREEESCICFPSVEYFNVNLRFLLSQEVLFCCLFLLSWRWFKK